MCPQAQYTVPGAVVEDIPASAVPVNSGMGFGDGNAMFSTWVDVVHASMSVEGAHPPFESCV